MADNKNQAIDEAKDAALSSVGFMLPVTKAQSTQIRKSSLIAAREVVAVRKNIVKLVEKFKVYENAVTQIKAVLGKGGNASAQVTKIAGIISAGGNAYKEKEAEIESTTGKIAAGAEAIKGAANSIASIVPTAAILALAIPFLLTPEVKEMIGAFFTGLLEGLGFGKGAIDNIKLGLGIATGILVGYFSYKVISGVYDAFMSMKRLAEVMGLLGEATATEKNKIDAEKKQTAEAGDKTKGEIKDTKKDIKKGKKLGRTPSGFIEKVKLLMDKIGPKLKSIGANFLKALPGIGTILGIGFILYELFDIGRDIYDMFTGSPNDKEDEGAKQEEAPMPAATATSAAAPSEIPEEKPTPSTATAEGPASVVEPTSTNQAEPASTPAADGAIIKEVSMEVERAEVDLNQTAGGVSITTIDNSTTVVDASEKPILNFPTVYSITVGA